MVSSFPLYNLLKEALGEDKAQKVVEFIEVKVAEEVGEKNKHLTSKQETQDLKALVEVRSAELKAQIAESKADLLKWIIGLYMTGFLAMLGAILGLYFKK